MISIPYYIVEDKFIACFKSQECLLSGHIMTFCCGIINCWMKRACLGCRGLEPLPAVVVNRHLAAHRAEPGAVLRCQVKPPDRGGGQHCISSVHLKAKHAARPSQLFGEQTVMRGPEATGGSFLWE